MMPHMTTTNKVTKTAFTEADLEALAGDAKSLAKLEIEARSKGFFESAVEHQNHGRGLSLGYVPRTAWARDLPLLKIVEGSTERACLAKPV